MSRRVLLLTTPAAGRRSDGTPASEAARIAAGVLRGGGLEVETVDARGLDEADGLVRAAVADGVDAVVVCGGDGLVNLAIQHLAGTQTALGLVPAGTSTDTARAVGTPLGDPVAAARRVVAWRPRPMDLGRAGGRYFATVLTAGPLRHTLAILAELRSAPRSYVLELDSQVRRTEAVLVAVGNGATFGGGTRIAEGAIIDDGLLDVVVLGPLAGLEPARVLAQLRRGTHVHHPRYERHRVASVTIAAPGVVGYADGERFGALPLTVECVPAAVRVLW